MGDDSGFAVNGEEAMEVEAFAGHGGEVAEEFTDGGRQVVEAVHDSFGDWFCFLRHVGRTFCVSSQSRMIVSTRAPKLR